MTNKKGFLLWGEDEEIFGDFSLEETGNLIIAMLHYFNSGQETEFKDRAMRRQFKAFIKRIDGEVENYEQICQKRSDNGKKGAEKRWHNDSKCHNEDGKNSKCQNSHMAKMANIANMNMNMNMNMNENMNMNMNKSMNVNVVEEAPTASTSQQQLTDAILIEKYGIDVVQNYKRRVSDYAAKVNRPAMNTLQTVAKWIEQDGVGLADRNEVKFTPSVEHSRDFSTVEDEIFKEYFG